MQTAIKAEASPKLIKKSLKIPLTRTPPIAKQARYKHDETAAATADTLEAHRTPTEEARKLGMSHTTLIRRLAKAIIEEAIVKAYERVREGVIAITTLGYVDLFFYYQKVEGMGSGFIISEEGLAVTNAHVVGGFSKIAATLPDGEPVGADIVGMDPKIDVALLKLQADGLKPAELGDSGTLKVGQLVLAVGNPLGKILGGPSVTLGVVSGLNRTIRTRNIFFENLIQTDAAINPGNSGGPLVDLDGKVVGMTTAMIPYAQGIGFAIPINEVKEAAAQLQKYGRVIRPWIGIYGADMNKYLARQLASPAEKGVLIVGVIPASPAHHAGLRQGDIIIEIEGEKVDTVADLKRILKQKGIGEIVKITFIRGRNLYTTNIQVEPEP